MIKAQAALFAAKNWKKIAILILGIAFFPFMIIALMVSLTNTVSIEDDKVTLYMNISEEIGNKYGVYIDYAQLVGIDAVRYAQDFSLVDKNSIRKLADMFISSEKEEVGVARTPGGATKEEFDKAVFLGDSITYGLGKYVSSVSNRTIAVGGYTSKQGTSELADKVIAKQPPIVVINFGTNDAGANNPKSFIKNYTELIEKLQNGIPGVKIYINQIFPGDPSKEATSGYLKAIKNIPSYNDVLPKIASETGATLIDCTNQVSEDSYSDALHFNSSFYPKWLSEMEKQITGENTVIAGSSVRTLEEVAKELGFSELDIQLAQELSNKALELLGSGSSAEFTGSQLEFIESLVPGARESYKKYKIFPSLIIAQAIHESGWGKSGLATKGKNLFGIKAGSSWDGKTINMRTAEYKGNSKYYINDDFRKYNNFSESILDHGRFLNENSRYSKHGVFSVRTSSEQAKALQKAGYATDPNYAQKLINTIKSYDLTKYDDPDFSLRSSSISNLQYLPGGANVPLMLQTDSRWANKKYGTSTIKISGCGTTSVSMVVSGLTGKTVTPDVVSSWAGPKYYVRGAGSSWALFDGAAKKWGLKVTQISKRNPQAILNNLKKGNPIIVSMGRGDFTRSGHFIVLRGVDKNGKILVNDPYSLKRSQQSWSLSTIISQSSKKGSSPFWVFSK